MRYLFFLHGDILQEEVAFGTSFFGWMWSDVPLFQSDCRILYHQYLGKGSNLVGCGWLHLSFHQISGFVD